MEQITSLKKDVDQLKVEKEILTKRALIKSARQVYDYEGFRSENFSENKENTPVNITDFNFECLKPQ